MTDPNKAAVTESNPEFIARMTLGGTRWKENDDDARLMRLAEERVMIEEHFLDIQHGEGGRVAIYEPKGEWKHVGFTDLSTAIRSVVAKIGEGNAS